LLSGYDHTFLKRAHANPIGGNFFSLRDIDVVSILRKLRPEVLWVFSYPYLTHLLGVLSQRLARVPVLLREDQTRLHPRQAWKEVIKKVIFASLFAGQRGLYVGIESRRWFEYYGFANEKLYFTPYSCDNAGFRAVHQLLRGQKEGLCADFGIGGDAPVILSVSRLIDKKQPLMLLEAFRLTRSRARCSLLIVGTGPLEQAMRRKVEAELIPDVVFAGFLNQSQIGRAYAASDVFALMSREHETWGMVVNEAMNFGLPIVVSDKVGSASDLVRSGVNGYVVPFDSAATMSERLTELVTHPSRRIAFGRASEELVLAYNYESDVAAIISAVADAVGPWRWQRSLATN
jgi:glycosyltransferase involved in cell wall biosynthesis